ncbi:MAG: RluA family pseudouridine synthase [Clostridia bacterium]
MIYIIDDENVNLRIDSCISKLDTKITRSYAKILIEDGSILVNKEIPKPSYKVRLNDEIEINIKKPKITKAIPQKIDVNIIYEDEDVIVVDKEKGMVVHPGNGNSDNTLVNALLYSHENNLSQINGVIRPGIVHRIDKNTSGILVVAKNDKAHKSLSNQFKDHSITRVYVALVKGIVKEDMDIDLPIGRCPRDRIKMAVTNKNSKRAVTHIHVLKCFEEDKYTLIEAKLETGRTHQIRVHMAYKNHPLVGDDLYGKPDKKIKIQGQLLHAKKLGFIQPTTGKYIEFESEIPEDFQTIINKLK